MEQYLAKVFTKLRLNSVPGFKKLVVAVIGGTVLLFGICLIFLPGPAVLVIPAGLAILATEFVWARRWLHKVKAMAAKARDSFRR
jgi:tellurite resistance protein TerC